MPRERRNPYLDGYSQEVTHGSAQRAVSDAHYQANIIAVAYERVTSARACSLDVAINDAKSCTKAHDALLQIGVDLRAALQEVDALHLLRGWLRAYHAIEETANSLSKHVVETGKRAAVAKAGL